MAEIAHVQDPVCEYARKRGWLVRRLQWIGRRGAPDCLFARGGIVILVEFKDKGKVPTMQQDRERQRLRDAGVEVHMIDSFEAGRALLA